ncbi:hypothetical protein [Pseudonocardia sp.]
MIGTMCGHVSPVRPYAGRRGPPIAGPRHPPIADPSRVEALEDL